MKRQSIEEIVLVKLFRNQAMCVCVYVYNEIRSAFALADLHDSSGTDLLEWQYWFFMYAS
jgi:hypothetical protein